MAGLRPEAYYSSFTDIDPALLTQVGIEAVLLDVDNTLLPRGSQDIGPEVFSWVEALKNEGLKVGIVSNSTKPRVDEIARQLDVPFVKNAYKPFSKGYKELCTILDVDASHAAMVGDQSYTDILGAHFAGMRGYMVKPLSSLDPVHTKILRLVDKLAVFGMIPVEKGMRGNRGTASEGMDGNVQPRRQ